MGSRFNHILNLLAHYKYLIVLVVGTLIVGMLDENSVLKRIQLDLQIGDLKAEIEKYNNQYEADARQLNELRRHPQAIEKIARERYFMKADDEDIYVLSDDEKPTTENEEVKEHNNFTYRERQATITDNGQHFRTVQSAAEI